MILLSHVSSVPVNASGELLTNIRVDSLFPVALVLALALGGVYRVANRRLQPSAFLELRDLSFGVGCGCVLALAVGAFLHGVFGTAEPYPTQLVMAVIVTIGVITVGRIVLRFFLRTLTTTRVLVVGSGTTADRIMLSVRQDPAMTLVGRAVDGDTVDAGAIGRVTDLPELCRQLEVHRILVAASEQFVGRVARHLPPAAELRPHRDGAALLRVDQLAFAPHRPLRHAVPRDRPAPPERVGQVHEAGVRPVHAARRSLLAMSPLLLVVAVGVKLSSPGPVFFRQVRLGRNASRSGSPSSVR